MYDSAACTSSTISAFASLKNGLTLKILLYVVTATAAALLYCALACGV